MKVFYPNTVVYPGICLITKEQLKDLDALIEKEWDDIKENYNKEVSAKTLKELDEYYPNLKTEDPNYSEKFNHQLERVKQYFHYPLTKIITLYCRSKNRYQTERFEDLYNNPTLANEVPYSFELSICGYRGINLNAYYDKIVIKKDDDTPANLENLFYKLSDWANSVKPNLILRMWKHVVFPLWYIFIMATIILVFAIASLNKPSYDSQYKQDAHELLKDGITEDEHNSAIEILLSSKFDHVPEKYRIGKEKKNYNRFFKYLIIPFIITIILSFRPSSTLGIGKGEFIVKRWLNWIKLLFVFIPISILLPTILEILPP